MKETKKKDLIIVTCLMLIATLVSILLKGKYFLGSTFFATLTVLILPATYLWTQKKHNLKKLLIGALVFGSLFGFFLEFIAELNKDWTVGQLLFDYKILEVLPFENLFGHFGMSLLIFTFYEHFLDSERTKRISKRLIYAIAVALLANTVMLLVFLLRKDLLVFSNSYLLMGTVAIIPLILLLIKKPIFLNKFLHLALFFSIMFFILEIVGVNNGYWEFNNTTYIGMVYIRNLKFALDDFIFWVMLYPATITSYYEIFLDDSR